MSNSTGKKFREALHNEKPLQVVGIINAYIALMAKQAGFHALYLSGAGVANSSHGLPDLALTTLHDVLEDARRITSAVDLPLLVDIDTGWGNALMIQRTIKEMILAGVAAVHIEDQVIQKRCGHREGKRVVSIEEMVDRIKAAVDARTDPNFVIIARADAFASEGIDKTIERGIAYLEAGADAFFPEALHTLDQYKTIKSAVQMPVLANMTEFGKTPLFTREELAQADVDIALYPLTVNRGMNFAAQHILQELRQKGTQKHLLEKMQTRQELYKFLDYESQEKVVNHDRCN
jgi:methylisocitrate lyase